MINKTTYPETVMLLGVLEDHKPPTGTLIEICPKRSSLYWKISDTDKTDMSISPFKLRHAIQLAKALEVPYKIKVKNFELVITLRYQ